MNKQPVIIERTFHVEAPVLWSAISQKDEMKKWYFDLAEFKTEPGFLFQFSGGPTPERQYLHLCEISDVIPLKKLSYTWRYDGYSGCSLVIFELFGNGNNTLLRLTHEGLETFPEDNPDLAKENFRIGWDNIINISLKEYIEKN